MPDQDVQPRDSYAGPQADASIAGKSILFYWHSGWLFIVLTLIVKAISDVVELSSFVRWPLFILVLLWYIWLIRKKVSMWSAMAAGIIVGSLGGLLIAVFELLWYHKWWYVMNFIRQPVIFGVAGGVAGIAILVLTNLFTKQVTVKGGGLYGGTKTS